MTAPAIDRTWYATLVDDSGGGIDGTIVNKAFVNSALASVENALGFYNVKMYGATGNGSTDDTTAIAAAFTAAAGRPVYFPSGSYIDTGSHSLTAGQLVCGDGAGQSIILTRHATLAWAVIDAQRCTISDLSIQGNTPTNGFCAIKISPTTTPARFALVRNVHVASCTSHGLRLDGVWKCVFLNVRSVSNGGHGYSLIESGSACAHVDFINCYAESNTTNGWNATCTTKPGMLGLLWRNCTSILNGGIGWDITNAIDVSLIGCYSAGETGGNGVKFTTSDACSVLAGGFHTLTNGVVFTNSTGGVVEGVYFNGNTKHIWVQTGSSGRSGSCYFDGGTAITIDSGAVAWNDAPLTHSYHGSPTLLTDTGKVAGPFGAKVWHSGAHTIATATATFLAFDSEVFDQGGLHSTVTNNTRLTVPAAAGGLWVVTGNVVWNTGAGNYRDCNIYKNAARQTVSRVPPCGGGNLSGGTTACVLQAVPGDYFELSVNQDSGGNLTTFSGADLTFLSAVTDRAVSAILAIIRIRRTPAWWLILDCGHWYKWTGQTGPKADRDFPCPTCQPSLLR